MSKLNFSIEATQAEVSNFADRLGYMTVVLDERQEQVPNPETKADFLLRVMKEKMAEVFYQPFVQDIDRQIVDAKLAEKETMRESVRSRVTTSFKA